MALRASDPMISTLLTKARRVSSAAAVLGVVGGVFVGMATGQTGGQPSGQSSTAPSPFPLRLVTAEGNGPALYTSAAADASAIGYLSADVPIELVEPPAAGRALVRIRGGMRVRAYLDASRLGAIVQRRGRLRGTPAYLGGGDRVGFVGFDPDGRVRITARVHAGTRSLVYTGTYPAAGLGAEAPTPGADTTPPGETGVLQAMTPLRVLDGIGGAVVETLPAGSIPCRMMATEAGGYSVLIGTGPYLAGFVTEAPSPRPMLGAVRAGVPGAVPERLRADTQFELARVAAGTRVTFEGQTLAVLDAPALARIVQRHPASDEVDVFIAVDDSVAVRGMIPTGAVGASHP